LNAAHGCPGRKKEKRVQGRSAGEPWAFDDQHDLTEWGRGAGKGRISAGRTAAPESAVSREEERTSADPRAAGKAMEKGGRRGEPALVGGRIQRERHRPTGACPTGIILIIKRKGRMMRWYILLLSDTRRGKDKKGRGSCGAGKGGHFILIPRRHRRKRGKRAAISSTCRCLPTHRRAAGEGERRSGRTARMHHCLSGG